MAGKPTKKPEVQTQERVQAPANGILRHSSINLKLCIFLGIVSFLVYANSLKNDFVLDDNDAIKKNTIVAQGISGIPELLSTPYRHGSLKNENDYYRPLSLVTFAVEYQLFELNPAPYHFNNVLLFGCCVMLLFLFFDRLFERKRTVVAFIAALLFALHPVHTEVVANIKSRDELLCFFFAFLSLNLFIKYIQTGKTSWVLLGILSYFTALLAKETVITFLVVIPIIFFFYRNEQPRRSIYVTIGAVVAAAILLAIRYAVLHQYNADVVGSLAFIENPLVQPGLSFESKIATAILMSGYYIKFVLLPYPLISDYSFNSIPLTHFSNPFVILSLLAYLLLIFFGLKRLFTVKKDPYAFAILLYLTTITLFTNLFFLLAMGERFTFFGSAGFCLAVAMLIEKFTIKSQATDVSLLKQSKVLAILIPLGLVYSIIVVDRNSDWIDSYTLSKVDAARSPNNSRLQYFMGYDLENVIVPQEPDPSRQREIRTEAIEYFRKAISIYPDFPDAYANIGFIYSSLQQFDSAEVYDKLALYYKPDFPEVNKNLGKIYFTKRKYPQAIAVSKEGLRWRPGDVELYANISSGFGSLSRFDSAIYYARLGLLVNPDYGTLYENIAMCYKLAGNMDSAVVYESIAKRYNPRFRIR